MLASVAMVQAVGTSRRGGHPRLSVGGALSAKTVHNVHRKLSRALNDAVANRLLVLNPADCASPAGVARDADMVS